jgi:hypothetical protein
LLTFNNFLLKSVETFCLLAICKILTNDGTKYLEACFYIGPKLKTGLRLVPRK